MVPKQKTAIENKTYLTIGGGGNTETGGGTVYNNLAGGFSNNIFNK